MPRFFVLPDNIIDKKIYIEGDDFNHIKNVLRMHVDDEIILTCGRGTEYLSKISSINDKNIECDIIEEREVTSELPVKISLFQALPKRDKMELIIQKAVELGAFEIVPVQTKRCVVRYDGKKSEKKVARWREISKSAAKQSGRGIIPDVTEIISFKAALERLDEFDKILFPYELCDLDNTSFKEIQDAVKDKKVAIFIGPEGGFETSEVELAKEKGAKIISLGERILRTETAGMALLSIMMFLGENVNNE